MDKREDGRLIDVGYCLNYCGHQVLEKVRQGIISHDINKVYFNSEDDLNQYCLPLNSIEFVIPHYERSEINESSYQTDRILL